MPLRDVIEAVARRDGRRISFIPIPWRLLFWGLKTLEVFHLPAPFRSDSVTGIVFQNPAPRFDEKMLAEIGFRPFPK
jgi:hypothetical protein